MVKHRWQKLLSLHTQEDLQYRPEHLYYCRNYYVVLLFWKMLIKTSKIAPVLSLSSRTIPVSWIIENFPCLSIFPGRTEPHTSTLNWTFVTIKITWYRDNYTANFTTYYKADMSWLLISLAMVEERSKFIQDKGISWLILHIIETDTTSFDPLWDLSFCYYVEDSSTCTQCSQRKTANKNL